MEPANEQYGLYPSLTHGNSSSHAGQTVAGWRSQEDPPSTFGNLYALRHHLKLSVTLTIQSLSSPPIAAKAQRERQGLTGSDLYCQLLVHPEDQDKIQIVLP